MVEVVILLVLMAMSQGCDAQNTTGGLTRKSFPNGFVFGTASSAYQVSSSSSSSSSTLTRRDGLGRGHSLMYSLHPKVGK